MLLLGRILDVIAWGVVVVAGLLGAVIDSSPIGAMFPGGALMLLYAVVFIVAWSLSRRRRKRRALMSAVALLGVLPFAWGACPGVGIHRRGMDGAEEWLALIGRGQVAEAHASAELDMSLVEFTSFVETNGLRNQVEREVLGAGDIGHLLDEVHVSVTDEHGSTRIVSVVLRMRYFATPVVTDLWMIPE